MECLVNPKVLSVALLRMSFGTVDDNPDSFAEESGFKTGRGSRLSLPVLFIVTPSASRQVPQ
jgi:hypothetical protein